MLDSYARFQKPIILSEIGVPDKPSAQAQADWLRAFYAMAFEKPNVVGVTWYFVEDDAFLPGGGLFSNVNLPPRPAYQALADVIRERTTTGTTKADSEGVVRIEGYAGDYRIEVSDGARGATFTIHITERKDGTISLAAPTPTPTITFTPTSTPTVTATPKPTSTATPTQSPSPLARLSPTSVASLSSNQDWTWVGVVIGVVIGIGFVLGIGRVASQRK